MTHDQEIAWAAGLFEGEGWITNRPYKDEPHKRTRSLGIGSTDEDVIRRFHRIAGFGSVTQKAGTNKPIWVWHGHGWETMCELLELFRPFLSRRRLEALAAFLSNPPRNRTHCRNGHRRTSANTRLTPSGGRLCRVCIREEQRRRRARKAV